MFSSVLNCFVVVKRRTDVRSKMSCVGEPGTLREQFDELARRRDGLLLIAVAECFICAVVGSVNDCDSELSW